jgi:transmembrane sensor
MITPVLLSKYFAQQCTPDEQQLVEDWVAASADNKSVFDNLKNIWDQTEQVRPNTEVQQTEAAWQKVKARIQKPQEIKPTKRSLSYILTRAAAAAIIIIGMVTFYIVNTNTQKGTLQMVEISTKKGEKRQLALADGTTVWLNAETTIRYPEKFDGNTREVFVDGEAYFKVQHNAQKPFRVHTGDLTTQVLGTSFNVLAYPESETITVALDEGKVALDFENQHMELQPGYKARFTKKEHTLAKTEIISKHNLWRNNILDFNNITLADAAQTIERWFGKKVIINGTQIQNCRLTTSFSNPKLDEVLEIITSVLALEMEEKNGVYYLTGDNCN